VIKSKVFAHVPERLRARQNARMQSGVARDCFLDGPVVRSRRQPLRHQCPVRPDFPGLATGPDGKTIFVTESETGAILLARLEVAGKTVYSHS
jgi:hypothetical protein